MCHRYHLIVEQFPTILNIYHTQQTGLKVAAKTIINRTSKMKIMNKIVLLE